MSGIQDAQVPEMSVDTAPPQTPTPRIEEQIAALEVERLKVSSRRLFNLRRGLEGGIPAGTFFIVGGVVFLVQGLLRSGLELGYLAGALLMWVIGFLLYVLSCWSRWRSEEKRRLPLLAVLDAQAERMREELRRQSKTSAG